MSTRAQVIVKDNHQELWFYRHSDGYPEGALPTLTHFMELVKSGQIRNNVEQAAGWIIALGMAEQQMLVATDDNLKNMYGWKVGSYEPCACGLEHGDIRYLYTLDIVNLTIQIKKIGGKTYYADGWAPEPKAPEFERWAEDYLEGLDERWINRCKRAHLRELFLNGNGVELAENDGFGRGGFYVHEMMPNQCSKLERIQEIKNTGTGGRR